MHGKIELLFLQIAHWCQIPILHGLKTSNQLKPIVRPSLQGWAQNYTYSTVGLIVRK